MPATNTAHLSDDHIENIVRLARIYPEAATAGVACPHCGAAKGEQCISSAVPRLHYHRTDAARDNLRRQIKDGSY